MLRFGLIGISFAFMAFAFYEMSGGSDFDTESLRQARLAVEQPSAETTTPNPSRVAQTEESRDEVTRVSLNLTSVQDIATSERTVQSDPAAQVEQTAPDQVIAASTSPSKENAGDRPRAVYPSLIPGATPEQSGVTITPVDLANDTSAQLGGREIREVTGSRVNVRGGPGTRYSVVDSLTRGEQVIILQDPGEGWVKLRPSAGGPVGWIADFLLSEAG